MQLFYFLEEDSAKMTNMINTSDNSLVTWLRQKWSPQTVKIYTKKQVHSNTEAKH